LLETKTCAIDEKCVADNKKQGFVFGFSLRANLASGYQQLSVDYLFKNGIFAPYIIDN